MVQQLICDLLDTHNGFRSLSCTHADHIALEECELLYLCLQGFCDKDGDWSDQPATALGVMEVSSGCLPR